MLIRVLQPYLGPYGMTRPGEVYEVHQRAAERLFRQHMACPAAMYAARKPAGPSETTASGPAERSGIEQTVAPLVHTQKVAGSSPAPAIETPTAHRKSGKRRKSKRSN